MRAVTSCCAVAAGRRGSLGQGLLLLSAWSLNLFGAHAAGLGGEPVPPAVPALQSAQTAASAAQTRSVHEWLARLQQGSQGRAYQGIYVVSSASGALSRARIQHVCDGQQQLERVDALSGTPRTTFRHNDAVVTFWPASHVVRTEKRDALAVFPAFPQAQDHDIARYYRVKPTGSDRVAGLDADVIELVARDGYRYGYRAWSEKSTGLLVKVQTLDAAGRVLEQSAFSELQLDAPVPMEPMKAAMERTQGYRVEPAEVIPTTAAAEGWVLRSAVPGFRPAHCYRRAAASTGVAAPMVQWVFSDGLASVSLFIEAYDPRQHVAETVLLSGATRTLTRRLGDARDGRWWLTVVGEVPTRTLQAFADGLVRSH